jgi:flagellum-specific ATP synthase
MIEVVKKEDWNEAQQLRAVLANYSEAEDLINIGAYVPGTSPGIDKAIRMIAPIREFLRQDIYEQSSYEDTWQRLIAIARS